MRSRFSRLVLTAASIFLGGAVGASTTPSKERAMAVNEILDISGISDMFNSFPEMIDQQATAQVGSLDREDAALSGMSCSRPLIRARCARSWWL